MRAGQALATAAHPIPLPAAPSRPYPRRMRALGLAALLVYTFGAFAFGAVLLLWVTQVRSRRWAAPDAACGPGGREGHAVNGALLVVSLLWFCCNVALVLFRLVPLRTPWQLDVLSISLAFTFPPIIMHTTLGEVAAAQPRMSSAWRAALWPAYAAAFLIPATAFALFLLPGVDDAGGRFGNTLLGFGLSAAFVTAAAYSIAIIATHGAAREPRRERGRQWTLGLFGLTAVLFVMLLGLTLLAGTARPLPALVEITAKSLPLVFLFVGTYHENQFQFFDLFVKRGAAVLLSVAALTAWFGVVFPALKPFGTSWAAPWIYAIALLPVVVALPWVHRRVRAVLDSRWLGRRYSTIEAVKHFLGTLRSATTEPMLIVRAQTGLEEIFGASATVLLGTGNAPAVPFAVEVPVRSGDRTVGRFLMGPRLSEAPYFSEDLALLASLADVFSHVVENLHLQERKLEQEQRTREMSLQASRSELKALRAQINPHFLFNALNSIAGLIHRDPAVADRTIEQLADVFRYALRGAESEWAVLDDELDFVRAYLEVERARFGDRLRVDVQLEEGARGARVPTMIVQTLVENAVKHGAATVRGKAVVIVHAREESGRLVVSVVDNGPGFSEDAAATARTRGGYGLVNIRQRLEGYFESSAALTVDRDDGAGMTTVSVTLPLLRQEPRSQRAVEHA
jgi:signal transduction histidine kinase